LTKFLLVAEADQIQKTIFKATRLAEIIGGSQLLTNWCNEKAEELREFGILEEDIIIADGGAFRIIFNKYEDCEHWGMRLAEDYASVIGGTISVTKPLPINDENSFREVSVLAQLELRKMKNNPLPISVNQHNPFVNICDVCGSGLGNEKIENYQQISGNNDNTVHDKRKILCRSCNNKLKLAQESHFKSNFLAHVKNCFQGTQKDQITLRMPQEVEELASYKVRNNIAYIVADGNDMGVLFSTCNKAQMKSLSTELPKIINETIAIVTARMIVKLYEEEFAAGKPFEVICLVVPLILGGDDIYIQLAAPYSLDFVRMFTSLYIDRMQTFKRENGLQGEKAGICFGLVICKAKYPHTLAYDHAHKFLNQSKVAAKAGRVGINADQVSRSLISFGVAEANHRLEGHYQPSLQPYSTEDIASRRHLSLKELISYRSKLKDVPSSRLAEWHKFYDISVLPERPRSQAKDNWISDFRYFRQRTSINPSINTLLYEALVTLGSDNEEELYMRSNDSKFGSGIPDLLEFWDYASDLADDKEELEK